MHPDAAVEVIVCLLLEGQLDIAPNRTATGFFCAAVGRFHDSRAAAGHHCESEPGNGCTHLSSQLVVGILSFDSGRSENGYAWADEMQHPESAQKIAQHAQE